MIATDVVDDRPGVDFSDVEHILHPKIQNQLIYSQILY